jgi:hypothetical protein
MDEIRIAYPGEWESAYRDTGTVAVWRQDFPHLFESERQSDTPGTLSLFAQYALQYLLRKHHDIESVTWYKLASTSPVARNRLRTDAAWEKLRAVMGDDFGTLQRAIIDAGFKNFDGEPDLFCWGMSGRWFFAEAKRRDRLGESQLRWFQVCRDALGARADIRVYRLVPRR